MLTGLESETPEFKVEAVQVAIYGGIREINIINVGLELSEMTGVDLVSVDKTVLDEKREIARVTYAVKGISKNGDPYREQRDISKD